MKSTVLSALFLLLCPSLLYAQAVSINTDASNPDPSAILDVKSTGKGVLVPRMTTAQRAAIASPATGLLVFDTNTGSFWFYTGTAWTDLSAQKQLTDADKDTQIQVEESPDEDIIRFDVGGAEKMVLRKNAQGAARLELPDAGSNTMIGQNAGANTNPAAGLYNTFLGYTSGSANTSGISNTFLGARAGLNSSTGNYNTATGHGALYANTTGFYNTAVGVSTLRDNQTGYENTALGSSAGESNTTGNYNTFIGHLNNWVVTTASNITSVGSWDGFSLLNNVPFGSDNTYLGKDAGNSSTQGNKLTLIGNYANVYNVSTSPSVTTATAIGYNAKVNCSNCLVLGGIGPDSVDVGIGLHTPVSDLHIVQKYGFAGLDKLGVRLQDRDGTFWNTYVDFADDYNFAFNGALSAYIQDGTGTYVAVSDARLKTNVDPLGPVLENVLKLKPKWYHRTGFTDRPKTPGFMAQEVENIFPEMVFEKAGIKGLAYDYFGVLAIKAIQEQQALIEAQQAENTALKTEVDGLKTQLREITAALQAAGIGVRRE